MDKMRRENMPDNVDHEFKELTEEFFEQLGDEGTFSQEEYIKYLMDHGSQELVDYLENMPEQDEPE